MLNSFYFVKISNMKGYPKFPYHPKADYPEFQSNFREFDDNNFVYHYMRLLLIEAEYDKDNIGKKDWNPFRTMIKDGQNIIIKPNLVMEDKGILVGKNSITTHTSFLRPILDYLYLLRKFDGVKAQISIADTPIQSANFKLLICQNKLLEFTEWYRKKFNLDIRLLDLRREIAIVNENGFIAEKRPVEGDPLGYTNVHLTESFLDEIIHDYKKFSISGYDDSQTSDKHSNKQTHYYNIPNTVISSDLFINLPKVKTHQKSGITIAMKNLIGINGDKSWIPHYRKGLPMFGGDEFSSNNFFYYINRIINSYIQHRYLSLWKFKKSIIQNLFKKNHSDQEYIEKKTDNNKNTFCSGSWHGNDTLWRPILDLNKLLATIDKKGKVTDRIQRKILCFSDGFICGEGNGPLSPVPKNVGLITLTENQVINDICCAKIMGFDWKKIPHLKNSILLHDIFDFNGDVHKIQIKGKACERSDNFSAIAYSQLPEISLIAPPGWINHIEL